MNVGRLKEILKDLDDKEEVFIRNSLNPVGNIQDLEQVEKSTYSFFGSEMPCLILNTYSSKEIELDKNQDSIDFIDNQK